MTIIFTDSGIRLARNENQPTVDTLRANYPRTVSLRTYLMEYNTGNRILLTGTNQIGEAWRLEVGSVLAAYAYAVRYPTLIQRAWLLPNYPYPSYFGPTYGRQLIFRVLP